jgi:hypothetical protein
MWRATRLRMPIDGFFARWLKIRAKGSHSIILSTNRHRRHPGLRAIRRRVVRGAGSGYS